MYHDSRLTPDDFVTHLTFLMAREDLTQRELAKRYGVGEQYLSDILNKQRPASANFAAKFGFKRYIVYVEEKKTLTLENWIKAVKYFIT